MRRTLVALVTPVLGLVAVVPAHAALAQPVPAPAAPAFHLVLPAPTGHRHLGTVSLHLVDRSRPDPWVATQPVRQLMVQIWYPAGDVRGYRRAPWVSPAVGAVINPAGPAVVLPVTHGYAGAPVAPGRHPVVLYSPGLGLERSSSTALVEDLASHGYVVVTIDHPHDAQVVELPDGHTETSAMPVPADPADEERIIAKVELHLTGSGHLSFTDLQVLLPQAGVPPEAMQ